MDTINMLYGLLGLLVIVAMIISTIRTVDQTERGLIQRFGKYDRFAEPGIKLIIPFVEEIIRVNITEQMVNSEKREMITKDNLNAVVEAQIYYRINSDAKSVYASKYEVNDIKLQIVSLAKTTLRNIIGTLTLTQANSERNSINTSLLLALQKETSVWGIDIVRTELKEITPPLDVQETMNKVVKAQNEKIAAVDYATAVETKADGEKRANIKSAEGLKQAAILQAEGQSQAIRMVNEAADETFKGNAQLLRKLETVERALSSNSKIVVPANSQLINVIGDLAGVPLTINNK